MSLLHGRMGYSWQSVFDLLDALRLQRKRWNVPMQEWLAGSRHALCWPKPSLPLRAWQTQALEFLQLVVLSDWYSFALGTWKNMLQPVALKGNLWINSCMMCACWWLMWAWCQIVWWLRRGFTLNRRKACNSGFIFVSPIIHIPLKSVHSSPSLPFKKSLP